MKLYDVDVQFCELTKELERTVCDNLTFTGYLLKNYYSGIFLSEWTTVYIDEGLKGRNDAIDYVLYGPISIGSQINFPNPYATAIITNPDDYELSKTSNAERSHQTLKITTPSGQEVSHDWYYDPNNPHNVAPSWPYIFADKGTYSLEYTISFAYLYNAYYGQIKYTTKIGVLENAYLKPYWTIRTVLERILSVCTTRRKGIHEPVYFLDPVQAAMFEQIPAPEFSLTRCTLREALSVIGGYIHGIPRLEFDESREDEGGRIVYDMLGGTEVKTITAPMLYEDEAQGIDEHCGTLDSFVQNLVTSRDITAGAISDPGADGYKTVRVDAGKVRISKDDDPIIPLAYPAERILKLECGYINGRTAPVGDITAYLYEGAEYDALSGYNNTAYPYSKAWALRYAKGDNKITALNFRPSKATDIGSAYTHTAIRNIIIAVTGGADIESGTTTPYQNLMFRVTYIPIISTRVQQLRTDKGANHDNALIYNQNSNVETEAYGENLRGAIARMGRPAIRRTYDFTHFADIPTPGQIIIDPDGTRYYVAEVSREFDLIKIRATVTLVKNFNKLSEYMAINSSYRLYDVSEKQSVDRYVTYTSKITIGNAITGYAASGGSSKAIIKLAGINAFMDIFAQGGNHKPVAAMRAITYGKSGNELKRVALPVISVPLGNSICLISKFDSNYGAGYQSQPYDGVNVQHQVPYGDVYGEFEDMRADYFDSLNPLFDDDTTALDRADMLPIVDSSAAGVVPYATTFGGNAGAYIIQKDNREIINLNTEFAAVKNRDSVIIGKGLMSNNPLVRGSDTALKGDIWFFTVALNELSNKAPLNNGVKAAELNIANYISTPFLTGLPIVIAGNIAAITAPVACVSWGVVAPNGDLIIGENVTLNAGQDTPTIYFNFGD
ncbi:MAG: hypothetical protein LBT55_01755 [Clostridiaceae bacterium]|jgi:hypothetical protein|nr:hypothetical protein [Clostridiaceae bacterium]